jgi:hypothetical protein
MRRQWAIVGAILLCLSATGCRMAAQITENLVFETCLFTDEVKGKVYYRMLANTAWKSYQGEHPDCASSADFAKGFKRGYADYLAYGGDCCLSHPQPPLRYWKVHHETPEGRVATVAWLDGFREGATAAKASGYRELIVVPIGKSKHPIGGAPSMPPLAPSLGNGTPVPGTPATPPAEELPVPHPLPDAPMPPPRTPKDEG